MAKNLAVALRTEIRYAVSKNGTPLVLDNAQSRLAAVRNLLWQHSHELESPADVSAFALARRLGGYRVDSWWVQFRPLEAAIMAKLHKSSTVRQALDVIIAYMPANVSTDEAAAVKVENKPIQQASEFENFLKVVKIDHTTDLRRFNHHPLRLMIKAHVEALRDAMAPEIKPVVVEREIVSQVEATPAPVMPASDASDIRNRKAAMLEEILRQNQAALELIRSL